MLALGNASGALYSAAGALSFREMPLHQVMLPHAFHSKVVELSTPMSGLLGWSEGIGTTYITPGQPTPPVQLLYRGKALTDSFGAGTAMEPWLTLAGLNDGLSLSTSLTKAFDLLAKEAFEARSPGEEYEKDSIELASDHFCVAIGGERFPVYLDFATEKLAEK